MFQIDTKERRARPGTFGGCPSNVFLPQTLVFAWVLIRR